MNDTDLLPVAEAAAYFVECGGYKYKNAQSLLGRAERKGFKVYHVLTGDRMVRALQRGDIAKLAAMPAPKPGDHLQGISKRKRTAHETTFAFAAPSVEEKRRALIRKVARKFDVLAK
jgi:hypothetical protein